jgi:hypothetical protein
MLRLERRVSRPHQCVRVPTRRDLTEAAGQGGWALAPYWRALRQPVERVAGREGQASSEQPRNA